MTDATYNEADFDRMYGVHDEPTVDPDVDYDDPDESESDDDPLEAMLAKYHDAVLEVEAELTGQDSRIMDPEPPTPTQPLDPADAVGKTVADQLPLGTVLAAQRWRTNGEMIADIARLYPELTRYVLDPTYGKGLWWTNVTPDRLVACTHMANIARIYSPVDEPETGHLIDPFDFRRMSFAPDRTYDAVVFDPPYVSLGGRETSTIDGFNDGYGLVDTPSTPEGLAAMNALGLAECARVVAAPVRGKRKGGVIVAKSMNYVTSGKCFAGLLELWLAGRELGLLVEDVFIHVGDPGPQPRTDKCRACDGKGEVEVDPDDLANVTRGPWIECDECGGEGSKPRRQVHARNNYSGAIVFRRVKP